MTYLLFPAPFGFLLSVIFLLRFRSMSARPPAPAAKALHNPSEWRAQPSAPSSAFCSLFNNWKSVTVDERQKEDSYYHSAPSKRFDMSRYIRVWAWSCSTAVVSRCTEEKKEKKKNGRLWEIRVYSAATDEIQE